MVAATAGCSKRARKRTPDSERTPARGGKSIAVLHFESVVAYEQTDTGFSRIAPRTNIHPRDSLVAWRPACLDCCASAARSIANACILHTVASQFATTLGGLAARHAPCRCRAVLSPLIEAHPPPRATSPATKDRTTKGSVRD